jgi:DHA1 family multidrug resistance protein-like MFS transporter
MGLSQNAYQLAGLRFLQGGASGTVAAATALVAAETPRTEVAWALGVLSSAIALGSAAGPLVGGVTANLFGLRLIFISGGVLLLLSTIPVFFLVRETPRPPTLSTPRHPVRTLRESSPGALRAVAVLIVAQALMQSSYSAAQQLVVLRLLSLTGSHASTYTGIAFALGGVVTAIAGLTYSRGLRLGYRLLTTIAAFVMAFFTAGMAAGPSVLPVIASFVITSLAYGSLIPAVSSMIGLESPPGMQATIYGASSSAIAIGFGGGPLLGGLVASAAGPAVGLIVAAGLAFLLGVLLLTGSRNPSPR